MTKAEWQLVTDALSGVFGRVELEVDGFEVALHRCQISKDRLGIMTYVNGQFLGKWIGADTGCRESEFFRPTTRYLHSLKFRKLLKKISKGIRKAGVSSPGKITAKGYDAVHKSNTPFWQSVSGIRKHYEKTFKEIKLIKINGVKHAAAREST